jgi:endonuclease/exonuclease/phosphatase family metal-dependent hydrolase
MKPKTGEHTRKKACAFDSRRLAWVLAGLLVLQACGLQRKSGAGSSKQAGTIKIMTYNIRHGAPIHRPSDAVDLKAVAAVINACAPDLVALQEVDSMTERAPFDEARELAELTGMHYYFSRTIDYQGGAYGDAILSRYPILSSAHYPLPMPVKGEDRAIGMVTTEPFPGMKLTFATTHLALKKADRMAQVKVLAEMGRKAGHPLVIAGDFNAMPGSAAIGALNGVFTFACDSSCPLTFPSAKPVRTIDYVIWNASASRQFRGTGCKTISTTASDHLPLLEYLVKR